MDKWKDLFKNYEGETKFEKLIDSFLKEEYSLLDVLENNLPIPHDFYKEKENVKEIVENFLKKEKNEILKERGYYILYDITKNDEYLKKIDEIENEDFLSNIKIIEDESVWKFEKDKIEMTCPMKLCLSSGNNSDRYGPCKLEGGKVLNMALNIIENNKVCPIYGELQLKKEDNFKIIFKSYNDLSGKFEFNEIEMNDNSWKDDKNDIFRFYKFVFHFTGIIKNDPMNDLKKYSKGRSIYLYVENKGPSKSGFSSSSSIMLTILSLIYKSLKSENLNNILNITLVAENKLGLRSGWNDTFSLLPGIHNFISKPTNTIPNPKMEQIHVKNLEKNLILIHTGIQRSASNRMNQRHMIYLSKNIKLYPKLLESIKIHDTIVDNLKNEDWENLGLNLSKYMDLRVSFDEGASSKELKKFFKCLIEKNIIHGGLLSGAMGGGIAQVILKNNSEKLLNEVIEEFKKDPIFKNMKRINYNINHQGFLFLEE